LIKSGDHLNVPSFRNKIFQ